MAESEVTIDANTTNGANIATDLIGGSTGKDYQIIKQAFGAPGTVTSVMTNVNIITTNPSRRR